MIAYRNSVLYFMWRLLRWHLGNKSPIAACFKVTRRCNLTCGHCAWDKGPGNEISTEEWKNRIEQAWQKGCVIAVFEGGEPTLRPDLSGLISYAEKKGFRTILVTNGSRPLDQYSPDSVWVSIEGPEEINDIVRGGGSYRTAISTVSANARLCKGTRMVITTVSKRNADVLAQMSKELDGAVDGIILNWLYPYDGILEAPLCSNEMLELGCKLVVRRREFPVPLMNSDSSLRSAGGHWVCRPWLMMLHDVDGHVIQGCMVRATGECPRCGCCNLGCYIELCSLFNWDFETRWAWQRCVGVRLTSRLERQIQRLKSRVLSWLYERRRPGMVGHATSSGDQSASTIAG